MKIKYEGVNRSAQAVSGELEALDVNDAQQILKAQMIRPRKLTILKGGGGSSNTQTQSRVATQTQSAGASFSFEEMFNSRRPALPQFTAFIRQLATMQGSGIPLVQALTLLADQVENKAFGGVLKVIISKIQEGMNFSAALKQYPDIFDKIFINLIAAGEISGSLDTILLRLSLYYEKEASLKRKIKSAMTYPIITLVLVVAVVIGMLLFVVPVFENMFLSNKKELPAATQIIITLSKEFQNHFFLYFAMLAGAVVFIMYIFKNEEARKSMDPFLLSSPIFGNIILKAGLARFSRTLGTLMQSGVPFLDALDITAKVSGNYSIETSILKAKESIKEGQSLGGILGTNKLFPKMVVGMITVGEQTGQLDQMLNKVAEFYEDEVDAAVGSLTSALEPLMIIIVGAIVMAFLVPLYLPIFKIGDVVGGS